VVARSSWSMPTRAGLDALTAGVPSGRVSELAEVAAAAVFLASSEASSVHGITLPVDGGMAAAFRVAPSASTPGSGALDADAVGGDAVTRSTLGGDAVNGSALGSSALGGDAFAR
jgi:hypothetical protein